LSGFLHLVLKGFFKTDLIRSFEVVKHLVALGDVLFQGLVTYFGLDVYDDLLELVERAVLLLVIDILALLADRFFHVELEVLHALSRLAVAAFQVEARLLVIVAVR
jgi:hypothetical protein